MMGKLGQLNATVNVAIKEFFMSGMNNRSQNDSSIEGSSGSLFFYYRQKFKKEAENLSKLNHPNIVNVLDVFDENNTTYYVMQFIDGQSLDNYIKQQKGIEENKAISIFKVIGKAVQYMHSNKMLHLDLKPNNVMLDKDGTVYLIDFGLSKQYNEKGEPESSTKIGAGTPGYAPIEQANYRDGKDFPVTMDVYALGATLFKMLTGVRPPEASDIFNDGFPLYELQEHNISDRITASVAKAMAPAKKDRYQTVEDFLNSFEEEVTSENVNNILQINSDTSKVCIRYCPYSLFPLKFYGAFITTVTPYEVNPNVTQESTREMIPMTQGKYKTFLDALQALKLEIREEAVEHTKPRLFSPAKLMISLYDKNGVVYNELWIDGMNGGNIVGNVDAIEKQIIQIVPGLKKYLNGPFYEVPNFIKEKEIWKKSSRQETAKPIHKGLDSGTVTISYRWWAILVLAIEIVFAWLMRTQSRWGLDNDGRVFLVGFFIASFIVFFLLLGARKDLSAKTWRLLSVVFTTACFANSLMLPMWNGSVTGAYFTLSIGLSFISSLTLLVKRS